MNSKAENSDWILVWEQKTDHFTIHYIFYGDIPTL